jgi:hypothetical protein
MVTQVTIAVCSLLFQIQKSNKVIYKIITHSQSQSTTEQIAIKFNYGIKRAN